MKISTRILQIALPIALLALLLSLAAGCSCYPPGTMPPKCQEWFDKGRMEGWQTGKQVGYQEGKAAGFQEGYAKGLEEGKKLAPACPTCPECPQQPTQPYYYPYSSYYQYNYPYPWR